MEPESLESTNILLAQVCRLHHARAHQVFDTIGIYRGQPPMLKALWEQDGQMHSELAARLHVKPATVSRMVQRMESAHLLTCKPDPQDQRVSRVYLTPAGKAMQPVLEQTDRTFEADTLAGFTLEERVVLRRLLLQIRDNLVRVVGNWPGDDAPGCED